MIGKPTGRFRSRKVLLGVAVGAFVLALALAETYVRATDADWRIVEQNLYFQASDLHSHVADDHPELFYRLRPGSTESYNAEYGEYTVTVNTLGARGVERPGEKRAGTFRIVCLGGSNVYGAGVDDHLTWPGRLEHHLDLGHGGTTFELWNYGTSAHTGAQMAALGEQALASIEPDLIIIALSNMGPWPFLSEAPLEPLFEANPDYWRYLLLGEHAGPDASALGQLGVALARISRFVRLAMLTRAQSRCPSDRPLWVAAAEAMEARNVERIRQLVSDHRDSCGFAFFIFPVARTLEQMGPGAAIPDDPLQRYGPIPGLILHAELMRPYHEGLDVPVMHLGAEGRPPEYRLFHPPPEVLDWYGETITRWLGAEGLVPVSAPDPVQRSEPAPTL